jgi:roadblock/LC7 domain-containing protein
MHIVKQLMAIPGVIAAGEYAYRGDRFSYEGALTDEFARMASILCRANTLSVNMQSEIFDSFAENCGCRPVQGWIVLVLFAYFSAFWLRSGQTLAMKTWRIRLVARDGGPISPGQAAGRFLLALLGLMLGGAGFFWALVDRDRQFLHDRLMGTRLVRVERKA